MSSIAERFAKLANTTPVFHDPEDDVNLETRARVVKSSEIDDAESFTSDLRKKASLGWTDADSRYAGKTISRKSYQESKGDSDDTSSDASEDIVKGKNKLSESYQEPEDDSDGTSSDDNENISAFKQQFQDISNANLDKTVDFGSGDSASESDEENSQSKTEDEASDESGEDNISDDDDGDISGEENSTNSSEVIQNFSKIDLNKEMEKGKAVQAQLALWDKLLELRIKLQKILIIANQLPQPKTWPAFRAAAKEELEKPLKAGKKGVRNILENLLELQDTLLSQNPETSDLGSKRKVSKRRIDDDQEINDDEEIPSDTEEESDLKSDNLAIKKGKLKRKLQDSEYPKVLLKRHRDFTLYRNDTIQKWNEKTRIASGKLNQKSFSAFEQSALKQVEQILLDKERLRKRTQLKRTTYRILGTPEDTTNDLEEEMETGRESVAKQSDHLKDYDPEIFDDSDFYHQLLRELIERKTANVTDPVALSRQWMAIQKLRSKIKRKVDTKASKGRKIRYDVLPKLISFMAPVDSGIFTDEARNDLFRSLFGQPQVTTQ